MSSSRPSNKRFLFDRSFDDPRRLYMPNEKRRSEMEADRRAAAAAAEAAALEAAKNAALRPAPEPEPELPREQMFTQSQLDAAREEGFVAGHTAALEEAETARSHYVADAINLIAQGLANLNEQQAAANVQTGETAIRLLFAIARKTIPETAHQFARENITDFVRKTLPLVLGEPKILIRAHAMIVDDLRPSVGEVFTRAGFQGTHVIVADYELQPGDCRMEWGGGGAERSEARIWRDIERMMAETVGTFDETAAMAELDATPDADETAPQPAPSEPLPETEQIDAEKTDADNNAT